MNTNESLKTEPDPSDSSASRSATANSAGETTAQAPRPRALREILFGPPRDVKDPHTYHAVSLAALLAWVGLGADGLSSSAYGPAEAFAALGDHTSLAALLALATALTVLIISYGYSRIIEHFPHGGGGYVVAGRLLGPKFGVVSGSALLVDYVLTISISIASGADAVFSFLPVEWLPAKLWVELIALLALAMLNLRGVKESITTLLPIFMAFLATHALMLGVAFGAHATAIPAVAHEVRSNLAETVRVLTLVGTLKLFVRAYSLGGGTYTGIEAVSNGVGVMREPRVPTAKRTMLLMAFSLAITAGGILMAFLLVHVSAEEGKTLNAVLFERVMGSWRLGPAPIGRWLVIFGLFTEGALLFVAAQAGFVDGPRVMSNMAHDSWMPRRFAALSDRLTMQNGVVMMGLAGALVLVYTRGDVGKLVVMYSINVFLTFSLSNLGMSRFWVKHRKAHPREWWRHLPAHLLALLLCVTILIVTTVEKFSEGGWVTLLVTAALVTLCIGIKRHYDRVGSAIAALDKDLPIEVVAPGPPTDAPMPHGQPVAVFFVGGYSGLGRHAVMKLLAMFPGYFKGLVFCGIAVVDSGSATGVTEVEALEARSQSALDQYVDFGRRLGLPADSMCRTGTEIPGTAESMVRDLLVNYSRAVCVGGKLLLDRDNLINRFLHNEAAFAIQRRLQRGGIPMIVLPVRVSVGGGEGRTSKSTTEADPESVVLIDAPERRDPG